jgi:hypothetical protein
LLYQLFSKIKFRVRQSLHIHLMSLEIHSTADVLASLPDAIASPTQRRSLS